MTVILDNVGKKFLKQWVFRGVSCSFHSGKRYAISGPNGSGKSTMLQLIAGNVSPSLGKIEYHLAKLNIEVGDVFNNLAFSAPYLQLIEEFTLEEMIRFHFSLKKPVDGLSLTAIPKVLNLEKHGQKLVRNFSSGMKQRLNAGLAILSDAQLLLLDEPTGNLDQDGVAWFNDLLGQHLEDRLVIVASNQQQDFVHCNHQIDMQNFKQEVS